MTKITIYNASQYLKSGKLKKKATAEMSLTTIDVEPVNTKANNEYTAKTIKQRGYHSFTSPYFFTHINALNDKNERVIIIETVTFDNQEIVTTPQSLYKLLTQ